MFMRGAIIVSIQMNNSCVPVTIRFIILIDESSVHYHVQLIGEQFIAFKEKDYIFKISIFN